MDGAVHNIIFAYLAIFLLTVFCLFGNRKGRHTPRTTGRAKMADRVTEMSRIRFDGRRWLVEIMSPIGRWIVQGVHHTQASAEADRKNWM